MDSIVTNGAIKTNLMSSAIANWRTLYSRRSLNGRFGNLFGRGFWSSGLNESGVYSLLQIRRIAPVVLSHYQYRDYRHNDVDSK